LDLVIFCLLNLSCVLELSLASFYVKMNRPRFHVVPTTFGYNIFSNLTFTEHIISNFDPQSFSDNEIDFMLSPKAYRKPWDERRIELLAKELELAYAFLDSYCEHYMIVGTIDYRVHFMMEHYMKCLLCRIGWYRLNIYASMRIEAAIGKIQELIPDVWIIMEIHSEKMRANARNSISMAID
jgi:hypothetical protein